MLLPEDDYPLHQSARLPALHHDQVRKFRPLRNAMVAPRLLGPCRDGLEAVLAQPNSRARCASRHAAPTQQLQHGFTARHCGRPLRRWPLCLVRLAIGFPGHGDPPD